MVRPKFYRNSEENVLKIFRVLRAARDGGNDYLSVSEIAKRADLHKWIVSRTVDLAMASVVDVVSPEELESIGLKIKLVRLNNTLITEDEVVRSLRLKTQLEG